MKSIIIGAGTYGEVYATYLKEAGVQIVGFLDDNPDLHNKYVVGIPVLGGIKMLKTLRQSHDVKNVYCPIGNNSLRINILKQAENLGFHTPNFIHSTAYISPEVQLGNKGVYVLPRTVVMPFTKLSNYVMISCSTIISHHTTINQGVFISFGCNIGASLCIEKNVYMGVASSIMTGVKVVGKNALIGAGSNVIKDVVENAVVAGNPAKLLKYKEITIDE